MNILRYFAVISFYFFDETDYGSTTTSLHDPITFEFRQRGNVHLSSEESSDYQIYNTPEMKQKLCYYAKIAAGLKYIDNDYVPHWVDYYPSTYIADFHYAMYCGTLETMYLFLHTDSSLLEITTFWSMVVQSKFDTSIIRARAVSAISEKIVYKKDSSWQEKNERKDNDEIMEDSETGTSLLQESYDGFDPEKFVSQYEWDELEAMKNRRSLCIFAQESLAFPLRFLSYDVPEPQLHEFQYVENSNTEIHSTIPCPTLPELFIRPGDSKEGFKLVIVESSIDHYEFRVERIEATRISRVSDQDELLAIGFTGNKLSQLNAEDRLNLCLLARKTDIFSHVPFIKDENVPEAHLYTFEYSGEPEKVDIALLCPAVPSIYLRLDDVDRENQIKIIFSRLSAARYTYAVEIVESINKKPATSEVENSKIQEHPFASMDEENRWSLCWAAQKRILNDPENRWKFRFTIQEPILSEYKLLLIPKYMESPKVYELNYFNDEKEDDVAIQCSSWPTMHIRLGKLQNEIKIILHEIKYFV